jgi:hypothetical protein
MSQTSCLDCYMSWRMPVCGLITSSTRKEYNCFSCIRQTALRIFHIRLYECYIVDGSVCTALNTPHSSFWSLRLPRPSCADSINASIACRLRCIVADTFVGRLWSWYIGVPTLQLQHHHHRRPTRNAYLMFLTSILYQLASLLSLLSRRR